RFTLVDAGVVDAPELGPLVLGVPGMARGAEGEDTILGAAFLLIAPRSAEGGIEAILVQGLFEALGLHHLRMQGRTAVEGIDAALDAVLVHMDDQIQAETLGRLVPEPDHFLELPRRVHMHQREWRL